MLSPLTRNPRSHLASRLPRLLRLALATAGLVGILLAGAGIAQAVPVPSIHNAIRPMKPCDTGTGLNSDGAPCSSEDLSMDSSRTNYGGPFEFAANDDDSIPAAIGFGVNFFGLQADTLYINNNGNVTFNGPQGTYTPYDLNSTQNSILAPFFADVHTSVGNTVRYGWGTVEGAPAFVVTWPGVHCYNAFATAPVQNSFQLVLISRNNGNFDVEFNYNSITWEAGTASDGNNYCLGGSPARAGFSNGTGAPGTFFEIPGSAVVGAFLDSNPDTGLANTSLNSPVVGRYFFEVRGGFVGCQSDAECNDSSPCSVDRCAPNDPNADPRGCVNTVAPNSAGTICRAATGPCDVEETCDGVSPTCPLDSLREAGTICADQKGDCDQADTCNGYTADCYDTVQSWGTLCRVANGPCDADDTCDGFSIDCTDQLRPAGDLCGAADGPCDLDDTCDGTTTGCTDQVQPIGTTCNASLTGDCDLPDTCDGGHQCSDSVKSAGSVCRDAAGPCDVADTCDGSTGSCPDLMAASGTTCRAAEGPCDVEDTCSGASVDCPDVVSATGTTCRGANGPCDVEDTCNGNAKDCPDQLVAAGTTCRDLSGPCDVAEVCNGGNAACPTDAFVAAGTTCRDSAGTCDAAEACTGSDAACPADTVQASGVPCRQPEGACDAEESCDGVGIECPADAVASAGTVCRPKAAAPGTGPGDSASLIIGLVGSSQTQSCDVAETCDGAGKTCPDDVFVDAGTACRAADGPCDVAESCTGTSPSCPINGFVSEGTTCRASTGVCDPAESCSGNAAACPTDILAGNTTVCRGAAGICDSVETCTGSTGACPADTKSVAVCRASTGVCDTAETCNGTSDNCPSDAFVSAGTTCRAAAGVCDLAETCSGSTGACPADAKSTAVCRASSGVCDTAETCDGVSNNCAADAFVAAGTTCRGAAGTCDSVETCTGSTGTCPADAKKGTVTVCRPSTGVCDTTETCNGTSDHCPSDAFVASTTTCRAAAGVCDTAETCTGSTGTCPTDVFVDASSVCRSSTGICDPQETCTGTAAACPTDALTAKGTVCRANGGACDLPETCTGSTGTCPADAIADATTVCRGSAGECDVVENCDGATKDCPADAVVIAATPCSSDDNVCTDDQCDGSSTQCQHPGNTGPCPDDGEVCTDDFCDGTGSCGHPANTAPCDDNDVCTLNDTCAAGACVGSDVIIKPACRWAVIGGSGDNPDKPKQAGGRILGGALITGDICGATMRVGFGSQVDGDIVTTSSLCDPKKAAVQMGPLAGVTPCSNLGESERASCEQHKVVTGGGPIVALPDGTVLQGGDKAGSVDCGTSVVPADGSFAYFDTTGEDPLVAECLDSRNTLASYIDNLDAALSATPCDAYVNPAMADVLPPAVLRIGPSHPESLIAGSITAGALNYVCIEGDLVGQNNATMEIEDGGNTGTEYVLVVKGKVDLKLNTVLTLVPPLDASRLLIYGIKGCKLGDRVEGGGSLLCPKSLKVQLEVRWSGSLLTNKGFALIGTGAQLTHVPLLFSK